MELYNYNISDISSLADMSNLTFLNLNGNSVSDLSPLRESINLHELDLGDNSVSDISPLAGLTHLTYLALGGNSVSDISPLAGLTHLGWLYLWGNPLSYTSGQTHIPALQRRGVTIHFDVHIPHSLTKVSGDSQEGPASTQLDEPFVISVLDQDGSPLAGMVVSFAVTAGGGTLSSTTDTNSCTIESSTSSTTATTDANGQAATRLTLGSESGTNTVSATVEGLEPETFTATAAEQAMPHSLTKVCGDSQEGTASEQLAELFVVLVSDENGAAMAGVVVTFSVTAGGGTLSAATATTDANGRAATRLTLGRDAGTNTVSATVEGLESVTFTATGQESPLASLFDLFGGGKRVALPDSPQLAQNAPNPFNSQTVLSYFLPAPGPAHLEVFTLTGQRVAVLHQGLHRWATTASAGMAATTQAAPWLAACTCTD